MKLFFNFFFLDLTHTPRTEVQNRGVNPSLGSSKVRNISVTKDKGFIQKPFPEPNFQWVQNEGKYLSLCKSLTIPCSWSIGFIHDLVSFYYPASHLPVRPVTLDAHPETDHIIGVPCRPYFRWISISILHFHTNVSYLNTLHSLDDRTSCERRTKT